MRPSLRPRSAIALVAVALFASGLMAGLLALAPAAVAQDTTGGWGIAPAGAGNASQRDFFVYQLKPGQGFQDTIAISNFTDQPLRFKVYARDAFNTPGDGGYALQADSETPVSAGAWIQLPVSEYTVPPKSQTDIPFNIVVPPDATPGDHAGGIIASLAPSSEPGIGQATVKVERRIAARVYVRVAGTLAPAISITRLDLRYANSLGALLSGGTATVSYEVKNVGNVRMVPGARLVLKDPFGRTVKSAPYRQLPELLPGGTATATVVLDGAPPTLRLSAELTVSAAGEATSSATRTTTVWAVPWILVIAAVITLPFLLRWRRRRRDRTSSPGPRPRPRSAPPRKPAKEPAAV